MEARTWLPALACKYDKHSQQNEAGGAEVAASECMLGFGSGSYLLCIECAVIQRNLCLVQDFTPVPDAHRNAARLLRVVRENKPSALLGKRAQQDMPKCEWNLLVEGCTQQSWLLLQHCAGTAFGKGPDNMHCT